MFKDEATAEHPDWCDGTDEWEPAHVPGDTDFRIHYFHTDWFQALRLDNRDPGTGTITSEPIEIECKVGSFDLDDLEVAADQLVEIKDRLGQNVSLARA